MAVALGFDGAGIEAIEMDAHYQSGNACLKMFTGWLDGGHDLQPATWDVLIQSLKAAELTEMANLLHSSIKIVSFVPIPLYDSYIMHIYFCDLIIQEAEDSSILSTMAVDSTSPVVSSTPNVISGNIKGISYNRYQLLTHIQLESAFCL